MSKTTPQFIIANATALYPKLDRTYRFDNQENRSVPCGATDDGAEYSTVFRVEAPVAKQLLTYMKEVYEAQRKPNWPEFKNPLKKQEDGTYEYKTSLKGAYNGEKTAKPVQVDAKTNKLPDDFQLTTGSIVNLAVVGVGYSASMGNGVSLRLRGVQVVSLAERADSNPFDVVDGFNSQSDNPFVAEAPVQEVAEEVDELEVDELEVEEAPAKPAAKKPAPKKAEPKVEEADDDLDALLAEFDD